MINDDNLIIDAPLVHQLIATQFPQWADLTITAVELSGWDNRTFHLGADKVVRLPSDVEYSGQVEKEHQWLPKLAPLVPLPIPTPLAMGEPAEGYPWHWSIYRWLDGKTASIDRITDLCQFAKTLAEFLLALHHIDSSDGPMTGPQNFYRGGPLSFYDDEARQAIKILTNEIDADATLAVWTTALSSTWQSPPVWVHGDIVDGNLLVENGQLSAVIDFGLMGIGDPACDLAIAWTFFTGKSREAFRAALPLDSATWARGRGWALWKALIICANLPGTNSLDIAKSRRVINEVLSDHKVEMTQRTPD